MKKSVIIIFTIISSYAVAADSAAPSPAQQIRKAFINDCAARGIQKQEDALSSAKFCTCAFDVIAHELTVEEYLEMDKASRERRPLDSLPALLRVKEKLKSCKQ